MPLFNAALFGAPTRLVTITDSSEAEVDLFELFGSPLGPITGVAVFETGSVTSKVQALGFAFGTRLFLTFKGHSLGQGGKGGNGGDAFYDPEGLSQTTAGQNGFPGGPALELDAPAWITITEETGGNLWGGGGGGGGGPGVVTGSVPSGGTGGGGGVSGGLGGDGGSASGGTPVQGDDGSNATDGTGASPGTATGADGGSWARPGKSAADSAVGTKGGKGGAAGPAMRLYGITFADLTFTKASWETLQAFGQVRGDYEEL